MKQQGIYLNDDPTCHHHAVKNSDGSITVSAYDEGGLENAIKLSADEMEALDRYRRSCFVRPRIVVNSDGIQWKIDDGKVVGADLQDQQNGVWYGTNMFMTTNERIRIWADLLNNPTVSVDNDA
jgi:hypothetical protein